MGSETRPYRLLKGSYGRREDGGRVIEYAAKIPGRDIIELTDDDALAMAARIEPVSPVVAGTDAGTQPSDAEKDAEVHSTPAAEAIKRIHEIESVDDLRVVEARETRNPKGARKTVLNAIADRIAHLSS